LLHQVTEGAAAESDLSPGKWGIRHGRPVTTRTGILGLAPFDGFRHQFEFRLAVPLSEMSRVTRSPALGVVLGRPAAREALPLIFTVPYNKVRFWPVDNCANAVTDEKTTRGRPQQNARLAVLWLKRSFGVFHFRFTMLAARYGPTLKPQSVVKGEFL